MPSTNHTPSLDAAEELQTTPPRLALENFCEKARLESLDRSTRCEAPEMVIAKVDDMFGSVELAQRLMAAASITSGEEIDVDVNGRHAERFAAVAQDGEGIRAAAASNLSEAFTTADSRADRINPEALTRIASSHRGHRAGIISRVSGEYASDWLVATSNSRHQIAPLPAGDSNRAPNVSDRGSITGADDAGSHDPGVRATFLTT